MRLDELTDKQIEMIDSGQATVWDGEFRVFEKMMEEMAGMPTEEMGKRQPGERCMYERK